MTNAIESEQLTRVGPGTVMGELMRQYWLPAAMSSELVAGGDPLRLMLLGEKLIAFRDSAGPGRRDGPSLPAPLRLAVPRPQRGGRHPLRLSRLEVRRRRQLHRHAERAAGAGFQAKGQGQGLQGRPSAPASSGSTWATRAEAPPLPEIEATLLPESELSDHVHAARMQLAAGAGRRHRHLAFRLPACRRRSARADVDRGQPVPLYRSPTARPNTTSTDTDWGTMYGAYRAGRGRAGPTGASRISCSRSGRRRRRASSPSTCIAAPGCRWTTRTRCSSAFSWKQASALRAALTGRQADPGSTAAPEILPNTTDWYGRWRLRRRTRRTTSRSTARRSATAASTPASTASTCRTRRSPRAWAPITDHSFEHWRRATR